MNGSNPKPPQFSPQPPKKRPPVRRRPVSMSTPWLLIGTLFIICVLMGLLLSIPQPPFWVWIATVLAMPIMVFGLIRPVNISGKRDRGGLFAYLGALVMVVALAVAANYIGSGEAVESVRFFSAIFILAALTLAVVLLTAAAAIVSAQLGARLMSQGGYSRSLTITMSTCLFGLCLGGLSGFWITTLS